MKRTLCRVLCALLIITGIPALAFGQEARHFSMAGFDGDESTHDWNTNAFFTRMEERTGTQFSFEEYTDYEKWQEAKAEMFSSGNLPDVFFKAELSEDELLQYTENGQLIDLKPLLAENAPNLWALLTENPAYLEAITLPNGKIGALPSISKLPPQNAMWINQTWLDGLKLSMPTDAESLREVLRAFQTRDPNQNGKRDEVPLSFLGAWDLQFLSHAFGVTANDYHLYVDDGGTVRFFPMEDQFVPFVTYLRELNAEKLLDQNGFYTMDALRISTDTSQPVTYGVFFGPNPLALYPYEQAKQYVLLPPLAYEGKQQYRDLYGEVTRGTFAISAACKDPAALLRWVDVLYTEEGAMEAMAGVAETDYTVDAEGRWQWVGGVEQLSTEMLREMSIYDTGNMPWLFPLDFYNRYAETTVERINTELMTLQAVVVKPFPSYTLTSEERAQIIPMQNELGMYVDESFAKFVLGKWEISEQQLAEFRSGLESRGVEEFIKAWQSIYDSLER